MSPRLTLTILTALAVSALAQDQIGEVLQGLIQNPEAIQELLPTILQGIIQSAINGQFQGPPGQTPAQPQPDPAEVKRAVANARRVNNAEIREADRANNQTLLLKDELHAESDRLVRKITIDGSIDQLKAGLGAKVEKLICFVDDESNRLSALHERKQKRSSDHLVEVLRVTPEQQERLERITLPFAILARRLKSAKTIGSSGAHQAVDHFAVAALQLQQGRKDDLTHQSGLNALHDFLKAELDSVYTTLLDNLGDIHNDSEGPYLELLTRLEAGESIVAILDSIKPPR